MKKWISLLLLVVAAAAPAGAQQLIGTPPGQRYQISGSTVPQPSPLIIKSTSTTATYKIFDVLNNAGVSIFNIMQNGAVNAAGALFSSITASSVTSLGGMSAQLPAIGANTGEVVLKKSDGSLTTDQTQFYWDSSNDWLVINGLIISVGQIRTPGNGLLSLASSNGGGIISAAVAAGETFGVGTNTPATKLDVNGSAQFGSGVDKSTVSAAGVWSSPGQPGVGASRTASAFSVPDTTATEILFNQSDYTQGSMGWTSKSTATVAGVYVVSCGVQWAGSATGVRQLSILTSNIGAQATVSEIGRAAGNIQSVTQTVSLPAAGTVSCYATQTSGGPLDAQASQATFGSIQKLW
jgi:hypothetical protein